MDNSLFYSLAILGLLALAALVAHGAWQARKASPRRAEREDAPMRELVEPTMDDEPSLHAATAESSVQAEPSAHGPADAAPRAAGADGDAPEAEPGRGGEAVALEETPAARVEAPQPAPEERAEPWLLPRRMPTLRIDALVDAIAVIPLESPVSGEMLLTHLPPTRRAGGKPFMVEGLSADTGEWETPAPNQRYGELQAGVLLANRTGPINEIEYSEFVQKIQAMADAIGALVQFPDMLEAVAQARELDAFASQHDAQLAVRLHSTKVAWSVGYIHQRASRHGFVAGTVPGRLVLPSDDEGSPPVLVLNFDPQAALAEDPNMAAVRDLTLSFDVPQTEAAREPFAAWQKAAQGLAADMEAVVVDDRGQPIGEAGFDLIGGELKHLYEAMDARGLSAGSMAARRLFS